MQSEAVVSRAGSAKSAENALRAVRGNFIRLVSLCLSLEAAMSEPTPPSGLITRAGDRTVTLHWDTTGRPDSNHYEVFRATQNDGPYVKVTSSPLPTPSFADVAVTNGTQFFYRVRALGTTATSEFSIPVSATPRPFEDDNDFLEYVQQTAFDFFWYETNSRNGLIRDRSTSTSPCSIASVGFGLTASGIGIDHGWITREQGRERTLRTLETFTNLPQGTSRHGIAGHRGWFYHFIDMNTGARVWNCELSSVDTALLILGVIYVREYFDQPHPGEVQIRKRADELYSKIDWLWMLDGTDALRFGWFPEKGFIQRQWIGYSEASFLVILGLGATGTDTLPDNAWQRWTSGYTWETHHGYTFVPFAPLFGHQYTACWIDLRYLQDDYMREKGITYFENSRRATLAQRAYCIANPKSFPGYSANVWGLTACDGPGGSGFLTYAARGAPPPENDDGTIAPTAPGGSLVFTPAESIAGLRHIYENYREKIWCGYGFRDAFNLKANWWDPDVIGIDQGPILLMAENLRTRAVWNVMKKSPVIRRGLERAGFKPVTQSSP